MVGWVIAEGPRARRRATPLNERLVAQVKELERGGAAAGPAQPGRARSGSDAQLYGPGIGPR